MKRLTIELLLDDPYKSQAVAIEGHTVKMYMYYRDDACWRTQWLCACPAMYMLFGPEMRTGGRRVYIGQTTNIKNRLDQHDRQKEFWKFACVFINDGRVLTQSDLAYLEYIAIKEAVECGVGGLLENCQIPASPACLNPEQASEDFEDIKLMLGVLKLDIFARKVFDVGEVTHSSARSIAKRIARQYLIEEERPSYVTEHDYYDEEPESTVYRLFKRGEYDASAMVLSDQKVYVFGSGCIMPPDGSTRDDMVKAAIEAGRIDPESYMIKKDMIFDTADEAEAFISGNAEGKWHPPFDA